MNRHMATLLDKAAIDQHLPWQISYERAGGSGASWAQHGMPALFERFIRMVRGSTAGPHLDIGCGNGVKTAQFAPGRRRSVGVDIAFEGLRAASERGVASDLLQADCVQLPFKSAAFGSASDILCFTHISRAQHGAYVRELQRILVPGGRVLLVLFSLSDEHFHGHTVSREYAFRFDPLNPHMAGYEHYAGKVNIHFDREAILDTFGSTFSIEALSESPHPLYAHRKLWNAIIRKPILSSDEKKP
jgi:ubiquinone/menaquinone biosynthesis C-methylase UbiE